MYSNILHKHAYAHRQVHEYTYKHTYRWYAFACSTLFIYKTFVLYIHTYIVVHVCMHAKA